jgi:hypothetical protein
MDKSANYFRLWIYIFGNRKKNKEQILHAECIVPRRICIVSFNELIMEQPPARYISAAVRQLLKSAPFWYKN